MKSNGTEMSARKMAIIATAVGVVAWVVGFFTYFAFAQFRGLYVFFAVISAVLLAMHIKMANMSRQVEGDPLKKIVTVSIVCFALQLLFFGALAILGPAAVPWAGKVFFIITALYMLFPVFVYYAAKKHGL